MAARSCLLAVGLLHVPLATMPAERRRRRVELAVAAAESGYALAETFEMSDNALQEDVAFQELEAVAAQVDAAAVVVAGAVDLQRVHGVAVRVRMVVVEAWGYESGECASPPAPSSAPQETLASLAE